MDYELTIIIVNWNTKQLVLDCLETIYANKLRSKWKVVVVDNASKDGSVDSFRAVYPQVEVVANNENVGFSAANNQILMRNDSQYYLLLNSDTYVIGDVLQRSIEFMDSSPDVGVMGCRVLNPDKSLQFTCSKFPTVFGKFKQIFQFGKLSGGQYKSDELMTDWLRDSTRDVDVISGCYLLVRNKVINEVGVLDEEYFFFGEETDWCFRIKKQGWRLVFSPVGEIVHYGSFSAKKLNYKRDLMLTSALVRFMLKNHTILDALLMYIVLFVFNLSRFVVWFLISLFKRDEYTLSRMKLFGLCVFKYFKAWPSGRSEW